MAKLKFYVAEVPCCGSMNYAVWTVRASSLADAYARIQRSGGKRPSFVKAIEDYPQRHWQCR